MAKKINKHCPNCGAPVTSEVCPYCHVFTGLNTKNADMEYPLMDCHECHLNFWNVWFPMIFAVSFGFFGFIFPLIFALIDPNTAIIAFLSCSIFGIIGIVALVIALRSISRYNTIKKYGIEKEATVYGYMDDNILLNDVPAQIVKLLVSTDDGYRFILYQLGDTKHPYKINSKIKILVYKDLFLVPNYY